METYKSAKTLWHYPIDRLGQLAQRGWRGDSGSPQSRGSLTRKLTPQKKAFVLMS